jgi:MoxR-like ATPase
MTVRDSITELKQRIPRSIIGQEHIVERLLIGLLANGNLIVDGLPRSEATTLCPTGP